MRDANVWAAIAIELSNLPQREGLFSVQYMKPVLHGVAFAIMGTAFLVGCSSVTKLPTPAAAKPALARGFQHRVFTDMQGKQHPFVIFVPARYESGSQPPVMLFLHGAGERGTNNIDPTMVGIGPAIWKRKSTFPFVTVIPQCRTGSNWLAEGPDAKWALAMLRQIEKEFSTDPDRVYLTGLSMGGSGTWSIAAKDPSAWAAIVPMCSGPDTANAAKFAAARLPIWNFCGDKDRESTVKANRTMHEALTMAGANAKYTEYAGVGHNCWDDAYGTDALYTWLLEQTRARNRSGSLSSTKLTIR